MDANYITTTSSTAEANNVLLGLTIGSLVFFSIFLFITAVLEIIGLWKSFKKAGEPGWAAIIPFYNLFVQMKIAKLAWWHFVIYIVLAFIIAFVDNKILDLPAFITTIVSLAIFVYYIIINVKFVKAYGKGIGMAIVCILFPFIGYMIIGCGSAKYKG